MDGWMQKNKPITTRVRIHHDAGCQGQAIGSGFCKFRSRRGVPSHSDVMLLFEYRLPPSPFTQVKIFVHNHSQQQLHPKRTGKRQTTNNPSDTNYSMGWFGGGNSDEAPPAQEKGFSDMGGGGSFESGPNLYAGGGAGGSGSAGLSDFQQFSVNLQQQMMVQQVITQLSHKAFEKCCPSSTRENQLTGREVACIASITNKWLDSNELLAGRLARKQQQASGGQQFG